MRFFRWFGEAQLGRWFSLFNRLINCYIIKASNFFEKLPDVPKILVFTGVLGPSEIHCAVRKRRNENSGIAGEWPSFAKIGLQFGLGMPFLLPKRVAGNRLLNNATITLL